MSSATYPNGRPAAYRSSINPAFIDKLRTSGVSLTRWSALLGIGEDNDSRLSLLLTRGESGQVSRTPDTVRKLEMLAGWIGFPPEAVFVDGDSLAEEPHLVPKESRGC